MNFLINCPDLAVILFRVFDKEAHSKDVLVAQYSLPVNCMKTGESIHLVIESI